MIPVWSSDDLFVYLLFRRKICFGQREPGRMVIILIYCMSELSIHSGFFTPKGLFSHQPRISYPELYKTKTFQFTLKGLCIFSNSIHIVHHIHFYICEGPYPVGYKFLEDYEIEYDERYVWD